MSIREYAKQNGFEIVGKLTKKVEKREQFNYCKGEMEVKSVAFWEDEDGNTYTKDCIVTADGAVI